MTSADRRSFLKGAAGAAAATLLQPDLSAAPRLRAPVRLGLVGCGRQGRAMLAELGKIEGATVAAVCDSDARRLRGATRRAPDADTFDGHAGLLEQDLDAVLIATPTHAHRTIAVDALAAGKHVYCEAPLAAELADCKAIAKAARRAERLVFQTGFQGRANPVYGLARSFVRAGAIRDVFQMRAQFHKKTSWMTPSPDPAREKLINWRLNPELTTGLIGEEGAQQFDVVHWFTGKYPLSVRATGGVLAWDDGRVVEDTVHVTFDFEKGARFDWDAALGNSLGGRYEVLMGTMGAVKLAWTHGWMFKEADAATQGWEVYANRQQFHNDEGITLIADATKLAAQGKLKQGVGLPHPSLFYALERFLLSVSEGAPVACSAEEGLRATAVALRAHEALRKGAQVSIPVSDFRVE
jgi:predicted dehydrogenase